MLQFNIGWENTLKWILKLLEKSRKSKQLAAVVGSETTRGYNVNMVNVDGATKGNSVHLPN